jgi:NDP-sugar pyrophosphorylase family protein
MNIVIPMAGLGSRFKKMGYKEPKPLIPIKKWWNKPMVEAVIMNLGITHHYIFICLEEIERSSSFRLIREKLSISCDIITLNEITQGASCTCLLAKDSINTNDPLIIVNCDQIIEDWDYQKFLHFCSKKNPDGVLGTFFSNSIKNSYIRLSDHGEVLEVREKEIISNYATNGLHYWKHGKYFVESAEEMIAKDDRVKGEFYVGPTYNYLIRDNKKILFYHFNEHYPIGTPEDLEKYERS